MSKHRRRKHRKKRFQRRTSPGAAPGVIAVDQQAEPPKIYVVSFDADTVEQRDAENPAQAVALRGKRKVVWVHVEGLGDAGVIRQLGEGFGVHALALEDVVNVHQHVKVEDYRDHLFIILRMLDESDYAETQQMSLFLGEDFVLTCSERASNLVQLLQHRMDDPHSQLRQSRSDFLAYAIIDALLDEYFPLLEHFGERLDELDDRISDHPPKEIIREVHDIRVEVRGVRRIVWQHREAINVVLRDSNVLISDETRMFLRDCHDHTIQLAELLEVFHENCTDLRDVYLSAISNRMNEVMMVLTIIATIFIPLSFIASLYGMNFNPRASPLNMPELNWFFGYPFALALMLMVALGLLYFFRRRGWIGRRDSNGSDEDTT